MSRPATPEDFQPIHESDLADPSAFDPSQTMSRLGHRLAIRHTTASEPAGLGDILPEEIFGEPVKSIEELVERRTAAAPKHSVAYKRARTVTVGIIAAAGGIAFHAPAVRTIDSAFSSIGSADYSHTANAVHTLNAVHPKLGDPNPVSTADQTAAGAANLAP